MDDNGKIPMSERAKVVAATEGIADDASDEIRGNRFLNFIYHHKALVFALCVVVILAAFSVWTFFFTGGASDIDILYAGPCRLYDAGASIAPAIRSVRSERDGLSVEITDIEWYSPEYIRENNVKVDAFANAAELDEFRREMTDGDVLVLFLSPELYRQVKGSLVPLKEIFGEKPWCAADDYAIELWLTDFYNYFTAAQELPEDTLICVRRASEMKSYTKSRAEEADEKARTLVKDIVEFASPVTQEQ